MKSEVVLDHWFILDLASNNISQVKLLVLVCTYNELDNLPKLVESIRESVPNADVLVVDDGSPDNTGGWVRSQIERESQKQNSKLLLIDRGLKLGLGGAIKAGLQYGMENGYEFVLNLDADFSHDPDVIPQVVEPALKYSDINLVIGSRYVEGGGLQNCSMKRIFVSRCANLYARWKLGWPFKDCSSAYRCYRTSALKRLNMESLQCTGYGFLEEILWHLWKLGERIVEVPITYTEREQGKSKISMQEATGTIEVLKRLARTK